MNDRLFLLELAVRRDRLISRPVGRSRRGWWIISDDYEFLPASVLEDANLAELLIAFRRAKEATIGRELDDPPSREPAAAMAPFLRDVGVRTERAYSKEVVATAWANVTAGEVQVYPDVTTPVAERLVLVEPTDEQVVGALADLLRQQLPKH